MVSKLHTRFRLAAPVSLALLFAEPIVGAPAASTIARRALSALVCRSQVWRQEARKEIETDKKYSRTGGVVDRAQRMRLQEALRWADEIEAPDVHALQRSSRLAGPPQRQ